MCQRYLDKEKGERLMKIVGSSLYEKKKKRLSGSAITTKDFHFPLTDKEDKIFIPTGTRIEFELKQTLDKTNVLSVSGEYEGKQFSLSMKVHPGSFVKAVQWLQSF